MNGTKEEKFKIKGAGRLLNWRPIVAISLSFGLGIFLCYKISFFSLIVGGVLALIGGLISVCILRKNKGGIKKSVIFAFILFIFFLVGCLSYNARIVNYEKDTIEEGRYSVSAVVKDVKTTTSLVLEDVMITDGEDVFVLNSNLVVYVYSMPEKVGIGSNVSFAADVRYYDTNAYGRFNANNILENTKYFTVVSGSSITVDGEEKFDLFYFLRENIRTTLFENMSERDAALSYAMMTGDESFVDSELLQNFRHGGIAHIFAVSGLHIGVICGAIYFLLKRIRMPWIVRSGIIFVFLFIYVGICGFSPSSVRALIMCVVMMSVSSAGLKYDRVNSFALASLIVLIINPVYLFSVGFQLSVAAVFGISFLSANITSLLQKIKFPQKLASGIGVSFSAQIATFPFLLDSFGYVPALSLFINVIFVPIISAVFTLLFFATIFALIFKFAADILLLIPELLLDVTVFPLEVIDLNILLISGFSVGALSILWYLIMVIASDKINLRAISKTALCILLCIATSTGIYFSNGGAVKENDVYVSGGYGHSLVYINSQENLLISYGVPERDELESFALKNRIKSVDGLIILGDSKEINTAVPVFLSEMSVKTLHVAYKDDYLNSFKLIGVKEQESTFNCGDAAVTFLGSRVVKIAVNCADYLFINNSESLTVNADSVDVAVAVTNDLELRNLIDSKNYVYFENSEDYFSIRRVGNLHIRAEDGIISVRRRGVL